MEAFEKDMRVQEEKLKKAQEESLALHSQRESLKTIKPADGFTRKGYAVYIGFQEGRRCFFGNGNFSSRAFSAFGNGCFLLYGTAVEVCVLSGRETGVFRFKLITGKKKKDVAG